MDLLCVSAIEENDTLRMCEEMDEWKETDIFQVQIAQRASGKI